MSTAPNATPSTSPTGVRIDRDWIAAEFSRGIESEQSLRDDARARADAPPHASLGVLYGEIAEADERHRSIVETIATRYGYVPSRGVGGGIGAAIGRIKDKVAEAGSTPQQRVAYDLAARADAMHWTAAWVHVFQALGDAESARELAEVLREETSHRDALQESLNRLLLQGATGEAGK